MAADVIGSPLPPNILTGEAEAAVARLDELAACPICHGPLDTPVSLDVCDHVYCAVCISRCLGNNPICPSCRKPARSGNITDPNIPLQSFLAAYLALRAALSKLTPTPSGQAIDAPQNNTNPHQESSSASSQDEMDVQELGDDSDSDSDFVVQESKPSSSSRPRRKTRRSQQQREEGVIDLEESGGATAVVVDLDPPPPPPGMARCPICSKAYKVAAIEHHVSMCIEQSEKAPSKKKRSTKRSSSSSSFTSSSTSSSLGAKKGTVRTKKVPKLHYGIMKTAQLKRHLEEVGLPTSGARKQLEWRHKEFALRFNAALKGKKNPTLEEIGSQVMTEENNRNVASIFSRRKVADAPPPPGPSSAPAGDQGSLSSKESKAGKKNKNKGKKKSKHKGLIAKVEARRAARKAREAEEAEKAKKDQESLMVPQMAPPWRVIYSEVAGKPFYFNTETDVGTFDPPPELGTAPPADPPGGYRVLVCNQDGSAPQAMAVAPLATSSPFKSSPSKSSKRRSPSPLLLSGKRKRKPESHTTGSNTSPVSPSKPLPTRRSPRKRSKPLT